ncbi:MAG: hypothetical protein PVG02_01620 [Anaerolineales bacterium]|jgi:hypothetical protein
MTHRTKTLSILALLLLPLSFAGCSSGPPQSSEHDAGQVALCDLNDDLIGWRLSTDGTISFIDLSPPDGVYFELKDGSCEAGGFAHNEFWNDFSTEQQDLIALGSPVHITGILTKDQGRMIVSVQELAEAP